MTTDATPAGPQYLLPVAERIADRRLWSAVALPGNRLKTGNRPTGAPLARIPARRTKSEPFATILLPNWVAAPDIR